MMRPSPTEPFGDHRFSTTPTLSLGMIRSPHSSMNASTPTTANRPYRSRVPGSANSSASRGNMAAISDVWRPSLAATCCRLRRENSRRGKTRQCRTDTASVFVFATAGLIDVSLVRAETSRLTRNLTSPESDLESREGNPLSPVISYPSDHPEFQNGWRDARGYQQE